VTRRKYEIELTASAARSLRKLERPAQVRIAHAIDSLADDPRPRGAVRLAGDLDFYRIRAGDYRIIYSVTGEKLIVLVIAVGHRRDIYRRL
jgi:mRNA interferase RelE/StbE